MLPGGLLPAAGQPLVRALRPASRPAELPGLPGLPLPGRSELQRVLPLPYLIELISHVVTASS